MKAAYILSIMLSINVLAHAEDKIYTFDVNNQRFPSSKYHKLPGRSEVPNSAKTSNYDLFWVKGIYSDDGNYKLSILFDPNLAKKGNENWIFIEKKNNEPFVTTLTVRTIYEFSDGRKVPFEATLGGKLPKSLGPKLQFNYLNYLLSDMSNEKTWSITIEVPNREPIKFTDIKVNGFREAMIKFRSGKWEKKQID